MDEASGIRGQGLCRQLNQFWRLLALGQCRGRELEKQEAPERRYSDTVCCIVGLEGTAGAGSATGMYLVEIRHLCGVKL